MTNVVETGTAHQISASTNCSAIPANLLGIFVSAASNAPTIAVYDSATTTTTAKLIDTFTPTGPSWYRLPISAQAGIYVVIGGTVSCTVVTA